MYFNYIIYLTASPPDYLSYLPNVKLSLSLDKKEGRGGTGEIAQWLEHLLLLQRTQVQLLTPTQ
jgi:hypothetical protein